MTKDREIPLFSYCDFWLDGDRENRVNSEVIYSPIEKNIKVISLDQNSKTPCSWYFFKTNIKKYIKKINIDIGCDDYEYFISIYLTSLSDDYIELSLLLDENNTNVIKKIIDLYGLDIDFKNILYEINFARDNLKHSLGELNKIDAILKEFPENYLKGEVED